MKKVLLFGPPAVSYRPGAIVKYLTDRPESFHVFSFHDRYFSSMRFGLRPIVVVLLSLLAVSSADIIVISSIKHTTTYSRIVMKLASLLGKRVVIDFYISSYETQVLDRGSFDTKSRVAKNLALYDRQAIKLGNPTIFLNQSEMIYYCGLLGVQIADVNPFILPLVVPERPISKRPYFRGEVSFPTIVWWGRMGNPIHGFDVIIDAVRILEERGFRANYGFFGAPGEHFDSAKLSAEGICCLENVIFSDKYSFNNGLLTEFLTEKADIALGTFGLTDKAKNVLTNKVLDASSLGLPCITQSSEGLSEYFKNEENILLCKCDAESLANRIIEVSQRREEIDRIAANALNIAKNKFSPDQFEASLEEFL